MIEDDGDGTKATLDESFEQAVVAQCLKDPSLLADAVPVLEAHSIGSPQVAWVWDVTRESWTKFSEVPSTRAFAARAARDFPEEAKRLPYIKTLTTLLKSSPDSPRTALEEIRRFVRMAHLHDAMVKSAKALNESDPDTAEEELQKALASSPRARAYEVVRWMEDFEERQALRRYLAEHPEEMRSIPTGLRSLDRVLGGGVSPGEFAVVMATTNKGKSIFLNNVGWHAAVRGYRVGHVTTEMQADKVAQRYDSRFTMVEYDKFKRFSFNDAELKHIGDRVERWRERLKKKLRIIGIPVRRADVSIVRQACADMAGEMGGMDLVIIDSPDHMVSSIRHREIRLDQAEVYWEVKSFAQDPKTRCVVWASTQAGKEWADLVAKAEAASESYDKSRIADLVLTLNAPVRKKKRKGAHVEDDDDGAEADDITPKLEAYLAKSRDSASKLRIPLDTDLKRMLIKEGEDDA